jgi:hypothetical protein
MRFAKPLRRSALGAAAAAIAAAGAAVPAAAHAIGAPAPAAATAPPAGRGIPAAVNPATDLAAHTPGTQPTWNDSIYMSGFIKAGGQDYGIVVQTLQFPNTGQRAFSVAVTNETAGWYKNYGAAVPEGKFAWSTTGLRITTPGLTWAGTDRDFTVRAKTPWGGVNLQLAATGPALDYAGTGLFSLLGDMNYEFALPALRTTGTLTVNGKTTALAGESWLDRQWGPAPLTPSTHWTWMNIDLSNGDKVAVWDAVNGTSENSWVTVLRPDGSYALAAVTPLAQGAGSPWTSPASGNTYPTRWVVSIPSLKAELRVKVTGTPAQEITSSPADRVEATAAVTGTYGSESVTGTTYVEMVGNWKA